MDISDELSALKSTASEQLPLLDSKKTCENVLLLPFFATLGYHPFDVREVEPEFPIQLEEEGQRTIDYAVKKGGSPAILFHLEEAGTNFDACDPSPLLRILKKSEAHVGALTDGIEYRFYADLESFYEVLKGETTADSGPFLTFNLLDYTGSEVEKLTRLAKPEFEAGEILSIAHRLKYARLFREYLQRQRENPDETFVRFMTEQVHGGEVPKGDPGMYESSLQEVLQQLIEARGEAQDRDSLREETQRGAEQSRKELDEENGDSAPKGKTVIDESSIDQNFEEVFREKLEPENAA